MPPPGVASKFHTSEREGCWKIRAEALARAAATADEAIAGLQRSGESTVLCGRLGTSPARLVSVRDSSRDLGRHPSQGHIEEDTAAVGLRLQDRPRRC
jgi:hypothetical protein